MPNPFVRIVLWLLFLTLVALGLVLDHKIAGPGARTPSSDITLNGNTKSF